MATIDTWRLICNCCIAIIVNIILTVSAVKYCNYGLDISSSDSLRNQSCSTEQIHLLSTLIVADQNKLPTYQDEDINFIDDEGFRSTATSDKDYLCFIFRHVAKQTLIHDIKQESVHINFGCDIKNLCKHKELNIVLSGEVVNGTKGQLYCCDSENCNTVNRLRHLPAENRVCYHGTGNKLKSQNDGKVSCGHPDVMCARMSVYSQDGVNESYFCDNDMLCQDQMSSGSFRSCLASVVNNTTQELCCCDASLCFEPKWPDPDTGDDSTNYSVPMFVDIETGEKSAASNDKLVITGLVTALSFVTIIGGGIIVSMACKKRRRPRPDPNVIMQYERLSATDPDSELPTVL